MRIESYHAAGQASFALFATPPGGSETIYTAQYFTPNYSLATTQTTYDSVLGNRTVTTNYGSKPEYGQAQSTTVDPSGLNLSSSATYESAGSGYLRQTSRSLPGNTTSNPASTYEYYGANETKDNPCTPEVEAYKQSGFMKRRVEADPDGNPATTDLPGVNTSITTETIYDAAGRQVATRKNQDAWTCTSYDSRGRAMQTVAPTVNGRAGRTVSTDYSFQGSPFKTQSTDSVSGSTVVETDLLGRQIASTDTFGNAYTVTYDNFGKVLAKTSPLGTEGYTYDTLNRLVNYKIDDVIYATLTYDQYSRIQNVVYPQATNGSGTLAMTGLTRDWLLRATGSSFTFADGQTFSQNASLSVSGITASQAHTFAGTTATNSYGYDNAGRLTQATIDSTNYQYGYAAPSSSVCNQSSANLNANKNSNRTSFTATNTTTSQVISSSQNCYNFADQLVASTDAQVGTPSYDDHGNTVSLAGAGTPIAFTYNASDQNTAIAQGSNKVEYVKSASGSVLRKKEYENNTLVRSYRFVADGKVMQSCSLTDQNNCQTTDKYVSLAGNVLLTLTTDQTQTIPVYSVKNFHGDTAMTVGGNGIPTSSVFLYEPFGMSSVSATFSTGSNPSNATSGTMGWAADQSRKQEQLFTIPITQMGARVYLPSQGRFLQVDPVEGGSPNAYAYIFDPVNGEDYSGRMAIPLAILLWSAVGAAFCVAATQVIQSSGFKTAFQGAVSGIASMVSKTAGSVGNLVKQGYKTQPIANPRPPRNNCKPQDATKSTDRFIRTPTNSNYEFNSKQALLNDLQNGLNVGSRMKLKINDRSYPGFNKYYLDVTGPDGKSFQLHYMYNEDTCEYAQVKIDPSSRR